MYLQWRNDRSFKYSNSKTGNFQKHLLAGEVSNFEFTQDCNMGGEYTRCFYKLLENNSVYQETPCDEPYIHWTKIGDTIVPDYKLNQAAIWDYIKKNYSRTDNRFQVQFDKK